MKDSAAFLAVSDVICLGPAMKACIVLATPHRTLIVGGPRRMCTCQGFEHTNVLQRSGLEWSDTGDGQQPGSEDASAESPMASFTTQI